MKKEATGFFNYFLLVNDAGTPIAVEIDGIEAFSLNDVVKVTDDGNGYICSGISKPGMGRIIEIRRHDTDHFFGVQMENGEFGYMKCSRMTRL